MSSADPLQHLGVRTGPDGGTIRVWSEHATAVELVVFDPDDLDWATSRTPLESGRRRRVDRDIRGPAHRRAIRPAGRRAARDRARVQPRAPSSTRGRGPADGVRRILARRRARLARLEGFDWGGAEKPRVPLDHAVVYETHVRGFSRLNERIPEPLRGTYAGLAHDASLEYLTGLGVTTVELLPVQSFGPRSGSSARAR